MKIRDIILLEAAYDGMVVAMKKAFPESEYDIDAQVKWAKTTLKKADRVVWYLKIVRAKLIDMRDGTNTADALYGNYDERDLADLQNNLLHYYGFNSPQIDNYTFGNQTVEKIFSDFSSFEEKWRAKQNIAKPVTPQQGDYELIKFPDGSAWWFVDRGYCSEEGRSGGHCGNVNGKRNTDERILSYRIGGHVVLTFILHSDGCLGEMKAKNNQKPDEKFHNVIMSLLLSDIVEGIRGAGWGPEFNFSIFDLNDRDLNVIISNKPTFISDQISVSPMEFLKAPSIIRDNPEYQQLAVRYLPAISPLLNGDSNENWEAAIELEGNLIINAPNTLKDFRNRVISVLSKNVTLLLQAPRSISRDPELLKEVIKEDPEAIGYIVPTTPKYAELCFLAVKQDGYALSYVPKELRDYDMCLTAVKQNGFALYYVPRENLDETEYKELCVAAVKQNSNALERVPKELRDYDMCLTAVKQEGYALSYVPRENLDETEYKELCVAAIKQNGEALRVVPGELRDYGICLEALSVTPDERVLEFIPAEFWMKKDFYKIIIDNDLVTSSNINVAPEHMQVQRIQKNPDDYQYIKNPSEVVTDAYIRNYTSDGDGYRTFLSSLDNFTERNAYTLVSHHSGWLPVLVKYRPELVTPKIEIAEIDSNYNKDLTHIGYSDPTRIMGMTNDVKSPLAQRHLAVRQADLILMYIKRGGDLRNISGISNDMFNIVFSDFVTKLHIKTRDQHSRSYISSNLDTFINLYISYMTKAQLDTLKKLAADRKLVLDAMPNIRNLVAPSNDVDPELVNQLTRLQNKNKPTVDNELDRIKELAERLNR